MKVKIFITVSMITMMHEGDMTKLFSIKLEKLLNSKDLVLKIKNLGVKALTTSNLQFQKEKTDQSLL